MAADAILDNFEWPYLRNGSRSTLYSAHRTVIFAIAQLSCLCGDYSSFQLRVWLLHRRICMKERQLGLNLWLQSTQVASCHSLPGVYDRFATLHGPSESYLGQITDWAQKSWVELQIIEPRLQLCGLPRMQTTESHAVREGVWCETLPNCHFSKSCNL